MFRLHGTHSLRPAQFCPLVELSSADVHNSVMFKGIYDKVKAVFLEIKYVVADVSYKIHIFANRFWTTTEFRSFPTKGR